MFDRQMFLPAARCLELGLVDEVVTVVEHELTVVKDELTGVKDKLTVVGDELTGVKDKLTVVGDGTILNTAAEVSAHLKQTYPRATARGRRSPPPPAASPRTVW
jgi:enoyl-CoA hydratase/carnithine racemase